MALPNQSFEEMDIVYQDLINRLPDEASRELCQSLWTQLKEVTIMARSMTRDVDSYLEQMTQIRRESAAQWAFIEEQQRQLGIRISALEEVRNMDNLPLQQPQAQEPPRLNPSPSVEPAVTVVEKIHDYPFPKKEGLQIVISKNPCILYRFTYVSTKVVCADCNSKMKLISFKRFHKLTKNCPGQMRAEITNATNLARLEEDPDFNVDHLRV